ncbi:MAG: hypothetical protein GKC05_03385 [Methanomicrobiales archaeon]|nr:hypothetical protein [Methanomicrobiales archaeon]
MTILSAARILTVGFLVLILIFSGCITPVSREPVPISFEESREIAHDYVTSMEEFCDYNGKNLTLVETVTLRCPYCWQFVYTFEMASLKDPVVTDLATIRVTVIEGTVRDVSAAYGSLTPRIPGDAGG